MSGRDVTAELAEALRQVLDYARDAASEFDERPPCLDVAASALARYDAERAAEKPWWHGKTCFACGKKFTGKVPPTLVDTRDDQTVLVGPECAKRVMAAGEEGYRYPGPGPRLYPITAALCPICGEEPVCDGCGGRCVRCARLSRECC